MYAHVHPSRVRHVHGMCMACMQVDYLSSLPFDGYAVGGSLGRDRDEMLGLLAYVMPRLPRDKPNHVLGIADPASVLKVCVRHARACPPCMYAHVHPADPCMCMASVLKGVPLGVDTFDSCFPTRVGRHGTLLTRDGPLNLKSASYRCARTRTRTHTHIQLHTRHAHTPRAREGAHGCALRVRARGAGATSGRSTRGCRTRSPARSRARTCTTSSA